MWKFKFSTILHHLAYRGNVLCQCSFGEFDKLINFSSEQCVDLKNVNGNLKGTGEI